jgi:hypothetical protein
LLQQLATTIHPAAVAIFYTEYFIGFPNYLLRGNEREKEKENKKQEIVSFFYKVCKL